MTSFSKASATTLLVLCVALGRAQAEQAGFDQLASEVGAELQVPQGFAIGSGENNPLLPYELTLRVADARLEARYAVRPIGRLNIEYQDPHNAAPEPEHIYPLMYAALIDQLAVGGSDVRREYPPEQARERYGADWAAVAIFDVRQEFASDFTQAMLLALHRQRRGEVYTVVLFNDPTKVRREIDQALEALRFTD